MYALYPIHMEVVTNIRIKLRIGNEAKDKIKARVFEVQFLSSYSKLCTHRNSNVAAL